MGWVMPDKSELAHIIEKHIRLHGPMTVDVLWNYCLSHPQYGYYIKQDPLGVAGDFITAPEISQMFGEMIGIWVAEQWLRLGQPKTIHLVEYGPGRGTLMADILRTVKVVSQMPQSIHIHLIETSPALRRKQIEKLADYPVQWHEDMKGIPDDAPCIILGNEFLDALPIKQFVRQDGVWMERVLGLDTQGEFIWGAIRHSLPDTVFPEGDVFELSPLREVVFTQICERITAQGGAALMIDYGHDVTACGDTLQAVKDHKYVDVLTHMGDADITSHVDFGVLCRIARANNLSVCLDGQGNFLKAKGIEARAARLMTKKDVSADVRRLVDDSAMGKLFRVMEAVHEKTSA